MIALVTLDQAKERLRIDFDDDDFDIMSMVSQASAILLKRIKMTEATINDSWGSPLEIPEDIQAVTLEMVAEMYTNREASVADILSDRLLELLVGYRDPTLS